MDARKKQISTYLSELKPRSVSAGETGLESVQEDNPTGTQEQLIINLDSISQHIENLLEHSDAHQDELKNLQDHLKNNGKTILKAYAEQDVDYFDAHVDDLGLLEVIVRTDGTRPSYFIRNGQPDLSLVPNTDWKQIITANLSRIKEAIACVGRIDQNGKHYGTGFLIGENFIITNMHVLEQIAKKTADQGWVMNEQVTIDFAKEFRAIDSKNPRAVIGVIFSGDITGGVINHNNLDFALLQLEECPKENLPPKILAFDAAEDWADPDTQIFTIGYPANPGIKGILQYGSDLLQMLFESTYGYKRIAPGKVIAGSNAQVAGRFCHDATTLGGNSGSVVVIVGREGIAAGIHYGGKNAEPRENWGHVLGAVLPVPDRTSGVALSTLLKKYKIKVIDRNIIN